jgi:hypothetical protein
MFQEYEIISIILTMGLLGYLVLNRNRMVRVPSHRLLLLTFSLMIAGWIFTVLEEVVFHDLLNLLEHIVYTLGAFSLAVWCRKVFTAPRGAGR